MFHPCSCTVFPDMYNQLAQPQAFVKLRRGPGGHWRIGRSVKEVAWLFPPSLEATRNRIQSTVPKAGPLRPHVTAWPSRQPMVGRQRRGRRQRSERRRKRWRVRTKYKQERATSENGAPSFIGDDARASHRLFFPPWLGQIRAPVFDVACGNIIIIIIIPAITM